MAVFEALVEGYFVYIMHIIEVPKGTPSAVHPRRLLQSEASRGITSYTSGLRVQVPSVDSIGCSSKVEQETTRFPPL
jgi:hypothetical protein